jgi:hypothetical protein
MGTDFYKDFKITMPYSQLSFEHFCFEGEKVWKLEVNWTVGWLVKGQIADILRDCPSCTLHFAHYTSHLQSVRDTCYRVLIRGLDCGGSRSVGGPP